MTLDRGSGSGAPDADYAVTALCLQGGGALGSYQGRVYQGLAEASIHAKLGRGYLDRGLERRRDRRQSARPPSRTIARLLGIHLSSAVVAIAPI